jgi:hypothetical protein
LRKEVERKWPDKDLRLGNTMRMSIASNNDGLLAHPIAHTCKSATRIIMRDFVGMNNIKALLEIHSGTKSFLSCLIDPQI